MPGPIRDLRLVDAAHVGIGAAVDLHVAQLFLDVSSGKCSLSKAVAAKASFVGLSPQPAMTTSGSNP